LDPRTGISFSTLCNTRQIILTNGFAASAEAEYSQRTMVAIAYIFSNGILQLNL
jgi:hypothetical protein